MISSELQKIGLSEKEARVYLATLELGPKSAQEISRHTGINRATCYTILESLIDLGFISQIEGDRGKIFSAEDPSNILNLLESQEKAIKKRKKEISTFVPDLMALYNKAGSKPRIRYLEGVNGIREIQKPDAIAEKASQSFPSPSHHGTFLTDASPFEPIRPAWLPSSG